MGGIFKVQESTLAIVNCKWAISPVQGSVNCTINVSTDLTVLRKLHKQDEYEGQSYAYRKDGGLPAQGTRDLAKFAKGLSNHMVLPTEKKVSSCKFFL